MFDPSILREHSLGLKAIDGDGAAAETLKALGQPVPILKKDWPHMEGRDIWLYRFAEPMLLRKAYMLNIPNVHFIQNPLNYESSVVCFDTRAIGKAYPENRLDLQLYGLSWVAYTGPLEPTFIPEIITIHPALAKPKFLVETHETENVRFNQGVGVQLKGAKFPIRMGHTYWMVPQREDYQEYHADFSLQETPKQEPLLFMDFPLNPVALPFDVSAIHITDQGVMVEFYGNQDWLLGNKDWNQLYAQVPLEFPHIFETQAEAEKYASTIQGWD